MPKTEVKVTLDQKEVSDAIIAAAREAAGVTTGGARLDIYYDKAAKEDGHVDCATVHFQQTKK